MADPVIMDDGGSIRIRQIGPVTKLDGLLDGSAAANNPTATKFSKVHIGHHANDGTHHLHPSGGGTPGFTKLNPGDVITITAASEQVVQVTLVTATNLQLDLTTGDSAEVEARTDAGGQRVYLIANADVIETVAINGVNVFDNTGGGPTLPSILTMVAIQ